MNTFDLGTWKVFDPTHQRKDKWQALKVLEEAAEVVAAAKDVVDAAENPDLSDEAICRGRLTIEVADLLQTIANLCDAFGITEKDLLYRAHELCDRKNNERGMFGPGPRTHMHREEDADD